MSGGVPSGGRGICGPRHGSGLPAGFARRVGSPLRARRSGARRDSSVVGLDATLLALVLGLLIWTSHGLFTAQQGQLQTIGRSIILLDLALAAYGPEAAAGRRELRASVRRARTRFWTDDPRGRRVFAYSEVTAEVLPMRGVFESLQTGERRPEATSRGREGPVRHDRRHATDDDQGVLVNPVPNLLLTVVVGWACLLFFVTA